MTAAILADPFTLSATMNTASTGGQPGVEEMQRLIHVGLAARDDKLNLQPMLGEAVPTVENGLIHVRKRRHQVRFGGFPQRPVVSLNRGFSAPVTLSVAQKNEDRMFLARHDDDLYCRWQALNTLFTDALIAAYRQFCGGTQFAKRHGAHPRGLVPMIRRAPKRGAGAKCRLVKVRPT